jgi:hypothetical protein
MFHTWACSHSNVTANPSTEVKGDLGTAVRTPSCFSALLKYSLQKINYAIAAHCKPEVMSLFAIRAPKTRVGVPAAARLQH